MERERQRKSKRARNVQTKRRQTDKYASVMEREAEKRKESKKWKDTKRKGDKPHLFQT